MTDQATRDDTFAAVDLGSNSFHLVIARLVQGEIQIVDRLRDRVQLGKGLDENGLLTAEAQERALATLSQFGERLAGIPERHRRAVGTNTLRRAQNAAALLRKGGEILGQRIEVVSGQEEARLVFLGVSHSQADWGGYRLVVDIGGGSTELILGEGFEPLRAASLYMGCISLTQRFFPRGKVTKEAMAAAETAAHGELQAVRGTFVALGWDTCSGSSGTINAIETILRSNGWCDEGITLEGLDRLRAELIRAKRPAKARLAGLKEERASVLAGGVAILRAIFASFEVDRMHASTGALREGVLYDLLGRIRHEDVRDRTIRRMVQQYNADEKHARRIERTALACFSQIGPIFGTRREGLAQILSWAARVHEVGLALSYPGYHKHSAYLLENSDLAGFSRDDQRLLATLVRTHRRKLSLSLFESVELDRAMLYRLVACLRLAVLANRGRSQATIAPFLLANRPGGLTVSLPEGWLDRHPLTRADLEAEVGLLAKIDFELEVVSRPSDPDSPRTEPPLSKGLDQPRNNS